MQSQYIVREGSGIQVHGNNFDFLKCKDPECLLAGGADTGKTFTLCLKMHLCACKYPGAAIAMVRKTQTSCYNTIVRTFMEKILGPDPSTWPCVPYGGLNKPERFNYRNGSIIFVVGLDKPSKLLSAEFDLIAISQAEEVTLSDWEILMTRATGRSGHMPYAQILADCNPAGPSHWLLQRGKSGDLTIFYSTHRDNPEICDPETGQITAKGEERLERLRHLTGHRLQRLYYGIWAPPEGAIFSMYEEATHKVVAFTPPADWPRFVGVDPFGAHIAAVWVAYDAQGMAIHVYKEYCQPFGVTTGKHVEAIFKLAGYSPTGSPTGNAERIFAWVGGGPSERQARMDFTGFGLPLVPSPVKEVWAGIDRISGLMREGRLFVHDCCVNLLSEIGDYRRKVNTKTGEFTDQIENKNDYNCIDSLRYVLCWLTGSGEETNDEIIDRSIPIGPRY